MSKSIKSHKMKALVSALSDGLLAALNAQLKDVESKDVTVKAPLTNLICERHFGHLDASQKRRPHSSLHHHTSVILLKQTRKRLRTWFDELETSEKERLMKRAKQDGKSLRKKHQERDRNAVVQSLRLKEKPSEEKEPEVEMRAGQLIAVACEDTWYPALVQEESMAGQDIKVVFADINKPVGTFRWPTSKTTHTVSRRSVVETSLDFEPRAGGRYWFVTNWKEIHKSFQKFK
ncbi:hypothetical protein ElyMa_000786600 [Elysia marginata]|uniref:Tudor domain-containing protein n=1 Tax=Elysia marginata TaxID=1093978 RepID=A0AAV4GXP1_9GAST|nr:hypothetical protein ElyMa_000786600 [Elysia marginata]